MSLTVLQESPGSFGATRRVCLPQLGCVSGVVAEPSRMRAGEAAGSLTSRANISVDVRVLSKLYVRLIVCVFAILAGRRRKEQTGGERVDKGKS